jgi:hypothetical protein
MQYLNISTPQMNADGKVKRLKSLYLITNINHYSKRCVVFVLGRDELCSPPGRCNPPKEEPPINLG